MREAEHMQQQEKVKFTSKNLIQKFNGIFGLLHYSLKSHNDCEQLSLVIEQSITETKPIQNLFSVFTSNFYNKLIFSLICTKL